MGAFATLVRPRWSDMDAYSHVNHARTVTLLEEARVQMVFTEATRHGVDMARGLLVVRLVVDYHAPLLADGRDLLISITVQEMRAATFVLRYRVHDGPSEQDTVAVSAETVMAPYDLIGKRPRRLSEAERDFLAAWRQEAA